MNEKFSVSYDKEERVLRIYIYSLNSALMHSHISAKYRASCKDACDSLPRLLVLNLVKRNESNCIVQLFILEICTTKMRRV